MKSTPREKLLRSLSKEDRKLVQTDAEDKKLSEVIQRLEQRQNRERRDDQDLDVHPVLKTWFKFHPLDRHTAAGAKKESATKMSSGSVPISLQPLSINGEVKPKSTSTRMEVKPKLLPTATHAEVQLLPKASHSTKIMPAVIERFTIDRTCEDWIQLWRRVSSGKNVLCEGSSGSGKSLLMTTTVHALQQTQPATKVLVLTGGSYLVAQHLQHYLPNNITIHPWNFYIRQLLYGSVEDPCRYYLVDRLRHVDLLIADDFQAVDGNVFQLTNDLARHVRNQPHLFFGGIQLVCFADFAHMNAMSMLTPQPFVVNLFQDETPLQLIKPSIPSKVMEQQEPHIEWFRVVQFLRTGRSNPCIDQLLTTANPPNATLPFTIDISFDEQIVTHINRTRVELLTTSRCTYTSHEFIQVAPIATSWQREELTNCLRGLIEETNSVTTNRLILPIGSQVLLGVTQDNIIAGTIGCVVGTSSSGNEPIVDFHGQAGVLVRPHIWTRCTAVGRAVRIQIPLRLAWALPVSLVVGIPLQVHYRFRADSKQVAPGSMYSVLSLVRQKENLVVHDWNPDLVRGSPIMLQLCGLTEQSYYVKNV